MHFGGTGNDLVRKKKTNLDKLGPLGLTCLSVCVVTGKNCVWVLCSSIKI